MRVRLLFVVGTSVIVAGTAGLAAQASTPGVTLIASAAPDARCRPGAKPAIIGGKFTCLRAGQRCKVRYQRSYQKHGFRCVNGILRKRASTPPPPPPEQPPAPPPPPPAPPAQPGHYKGLTSQLTTFEFDVRADGRAVQNLVSGQINAGCTPPAHLGGGELSLGPFPWPIAENGAFRIDMPYQGTVAGAPSTGRLEITGQFNGAAATGTLSDSMTFVYEGVGYSCGSGLQTWSVTRVG